MSDRLPPNPKLGIEMVCKDEHLAFFGNYLSGALYAEENFLKYGCKIISTEKYVTKGNECLGFKKGSPYNLAINLE